MSKTNTYHLKVQDGKVEINFVTTAFDAKQAISNLQNNSKDYQNIFDETSDEITIKIKKSN